MERSTFLEALENRSSLNAQSADEWNALAEKYPYASVVQLLAYQKKGSKPEADKKRMLLHFDNPLHLAVVSSKYVLKESSEIPEEKEDLVEKEESDIPQKKKIRVAPVSKQNVEKQTEELADEETELTAASLTETKVQEESEKDTVPPVAPITEKEDVLELINDLPEESPIKKTEAVEVEEELAEEETPAQDPGDLMVMMSFTDWLNHFKAKSEHEADEKKGKDAIRSAWQKEKLAEAMDDEEDVVPDEIFEKAMKSVSFGDGLVTEPLAELYVQQGKTDKAIELYKKLSLLNPEKRTYFASRIKDLHLLK